MTYSTLKTTVAAIALTAGAAWADTDNSDLTGMTEDTGANSYVGYETWNDEDAAVRTPANKEMTARSMDMQLANEDAAQEVDTLDNPQMGKSTLVPDSSVGVVATSELDGMTVADLVGMEVASSNGQDVGEIDYVFSEGDTLKVIVGVGGFLGMGEHDVVVPLNDLVMSEDDEVILSGWSERQLKAQPDVDDSEITALDEDTLIEISS